MLVPDNDWSGPCATTKTSQEIEVVKLISIEDITFIKEGFKLKMAASL